MSAGSEILTKMYMQPNASQVRRDNESQTYVEVWKGPWNEIKKFSSTSKIFNVQFKIGDTHPDLSSNTNWDYTYMPQPPSGMEWVITEIQCDEAQPAGDHGTFTVTYKDAYTQSGGEEQHPQLIADSEVWQLTWGTTSRSPLEYAEDLTGCRPQDILDCKKGKHPTTGNDKEYSWYVVDPAHPGSVDLNTLASDRAKTIFNYYSSGVQPMFHYPILKCTTVYQGTADFGNIGIDIDKPGVPSGMPFSFSDDWQWLYVGDNITVTKKGDNKTYTRVEEWIGVVHIDTNFYGDTAWEPTEWD